MQPRIDYLKFAPEAHKAMYALEKYLATCGLEHKLLHLLKPRASQINGCAYCIDTHSKDARAPGETEQRSMSWMPGARRLFTRIGNVQRWLGSRR